MSLLTHVVWQGTGETKGEVTYARRLEPSVSIDNRFDCQFGLFTVQRYGNIAHLERMFGNVSSRVRRFDSFVQFPDLGRLQGGGRITHFDEKKDSFVFVNVGSALTDDDAVSDKGEFFDYGVDFGAAEPDAALHMSPP